jgi:hypothetical protein
MYAIPLQEIAETLREFLRSAWSDGVLEQWSDDARFARALT